MKLEKKIITKSKEEMRILFKKYRNLFVSKYYNFKNIEKSIIKHSLSYLFKFLNNKHTSKYIGVYLSIDDEPPTKMLIKILYKLKFIPLIAVIKQKNKKLYWIEYKKNFCLERKNYLFINNIKQNNLLSSDIAKTNVIFVPALIIDKKGSRIGTGHGYYDLFLNYLKNKNYNILNTIALVYDHEFLRKDIISIKKHDVKINYVITPNKGLIKLN